MNSTHSHHDESHGAQWGQSANGGHGNHDKHAGHDPDALRRKFWLSLVLTIPVLVYSPSIQDWLGFTPPDFPGSGSIPFVFSVAIFLYGGLVFLQGAWRELRDRGPGMMTLISLAFGVAFVYGIATEIGLSGDPNGMTRDIGASEC